MPIRSNYWSCSKFADWLRGTYKPPAETVEGWYSWKRASRSLHPIRYWLAEDGLDAIQDFVNWPIDMLHNIKYYINNRWVSKSHALTAHPRDISPGTWCDVGYRFLPCLFNELQDFVEVELAWFHLVWDKENRKKYNAPFWAFGPMRIRTWRCPQAGLDHLEWEKSLVWTADEVGDDSPNIGKPTPQSQKAIEILELYNWWTQVYRNRPDPYEASGWSEYCDLNRSHNDDEPFLRPSDLDIIKMRDDSLNKLDEIEKAYKVEEEEMLIRLIKIREYLWT